MFIVAVHVPVFLPCWMLAYETQRTRVLQRRTYSIHSQASMEGVLAKFTVFTHTEAYSDDLLFVSRVVHSTVEVLA